jgi:hypothetical protein
MAKIKTIWYYGEFNKPSDCENWIASAFNRNGFYCYRVDKSSVPWQDFKRRAIQERPDACLFTKIPNVPFEEFHNLRQNYDGLLLWWTFDWMGHATNQWYWPMAQISDICFQTDGYSDALKYEQWKINRYEVHQAADFQHDYPKGLASVEDGERFACDVAFAGSLYTERRREIHHLLESMDIDYKYWGNAHHNEVWGEDFAKMCLWSKIVVGDNFVNNIAGYWSDRVYLTLGCGGFFLASYVPGLEKAFKENKHLAWYEGLDELQNKILFYLPKESLRKQVAWGGYRFVRDKHTYDNRLKYIRMIIEEYNDNDY